MICFNMDDMKNNSKGSLFNGYKMSNIVLIDGIRQSENSDQIESISIGGDEDDTVKEYRVTVNIQSENPESYIEFDLEDFLKQAKRLCPQLFN